MRLARLSSVAVAAIVAASCGGSSGSGPTVFAASSLTNAFSAIDPDATFNFGASDALAFQIEQGAAADVYASASPAETDALRGKQLIEPAIVFAHNALVLVVPTDNPGRLRSWRDIRRRDVGLVLAASGVPAGDYAREALQHLKASDASIVSEEPDVRGVLTKVALGGADAGIVYATDVDAAKGKVRTLPLPQRAQPQIDYAIAVVRDAPHPEEARAFIELITGSEGRAALRRAGFVLP